jgi:hypothetical protein
MKKLFALCLLLALMFEVKAQTKEETIDWLNTNGPSLLSVNNKVGAEDHRRNFVEIKNDSVHFYEKHDCDCTGGWTTNEYHYFIPVKSILFQDVSTLIKKEDGQFAYFIIQLNPGTKIKYTNDGEWSEREESNYSVYYDKEAETDATRVLKAIMNLAKLSGAKENKQTY